jgi:hypothetical protein
MAIQQRTATYDQYHVLSGGNTFQFSKSYQAYDRVEPGIYKAAVAIGIGLHLEKQNIMSDGILDLGGNEAGELINEVQHFMKPEIRARYNRFNLRHKRGILLYGPPGTGKTCIIHRVMQHVIDQGGIVLIDSNPIVIKQAIDAVREVEGERFFMVVWEELETWIHTGYEPAILGILDGEFQVDNVLYLSTTNYIKRIPLRIRFRPSRFATVKHIGSPEAEARRIYFNAKLPEEEQVNLDTWVDATNGLTLDHMKDLILSVCVFEVPLPVAVKNIRSMGDILEDDEPDYSDDEDAFFDEGDEPDEE